tara:strand:+ start:4162 stop:4395 length:234 start_codon:yes stop_codon:yes gene_type:complete
MSDTLKDFLSSGKRMILDTKLKKPKTEQPSKQHKESLGDDEVDPHKRFIKYCIKSKPATKDMIKEFTRFIELEEAKL